MKIFRSSQTYEDIVEIAAWFGADDPEIALRFYDAYEASLETIRKTPKIGSPRSSRTGEPFRIWFVDGFDNVLIIYEAEDTEVKILRVLHSARDYSRFI